MKALKSAPMSKVDSSDKLQELAETILEKTKNDDEKKLEDESVDPIEVKLLNFLLIVTRCPNLKIFEN